ncbi:hypothetical protein AVEN_157582-1 [Araneus ventricosus]|uniref:Peptidase A2 domain-containing protein n=1 Tax=Araneus ventricosus TaxID=182803 RepID=A0A4Y2SGK1_ARAVE|nr:hypothetical protein AVEN_157582-1 [Araneus ventricosus]
MLKRFKLSPEEFRKKFLHHQKNSKKSWREFTLEISNYFQEWIEGLKIDSFEKLKNLIITDQIKRWAPFEEWRIQTDAYVLVLFSWFRGPHSRFCPSKAPQKGKSNPTAQGNVITTTEPKKEDASTILTAKINVPVEVAANVMELETVQVKLGPRIMAGIIDSGAQISVIREDFTLGIKYEG